MKSTHENAERPERRPDPRQAVHADRRAGAPWPARGSRRRSSYALSGGRANRLKRGAGAGSSCAEP
jgi:hypothetical protein